MSITQHFYHKSLRRIIVVFGTLFNGYQVEKTDLTKVDVPLSWSSKQRWYIKLKQDLALDNREAIILPRMGFVITNITYDFARKTSSLNKISAVDERNSNKMINVFNSVPYVVSFSLFISTKTIEEGLQLIEQIIPYFTPAFSVTFTELDELGIQKDLPIKLTQVLSNFDKEGSFDGNDVYTWELNFEVEANLYKSISSIGIIKHVLIDTHIISDVDEPLGVNESVKDRYRADVDPDTAYITDEYEILESWGLYPHDEPQTFD